MHIHLPDVCCIVVCPLMSLLLVWVLEFDNRLLSGKWGGGVGWMRVWGLGRGDEKGHLCDYTASL